ncbi:MAG: cation diffusion facilitator family transporter [Actinomycetaceae bacterium]|nr:cation diffusion facilitator family transporter [Arcanobacterium sp.]MDD7687218.1 cation diffusion facilitator family transporter [Actinomycetaceae bacterium]MDY5273485.1 cation diffusion facilitator family transporter [Arcanobacterium sp.]
MDGHTHQHTARQQVAGMKRLSIVLAIAVSVLVVEICGVVFTSSLALLADVGHMLSDTAGLVMALIAVRLARRPSTSQHTWGWLRAEIISAMLQALMLIGIGVYTLLEAIHRLIVPSSINGSGLLAVGIVGLVGNIAGLLVLRRHHEANLNMRAAFLEVMNDAASSLAVIVSAIVIQFTGWERADAVASLIIVALIVPRAAKILASTTRILFEATPQELDLDRVREHLLHLPHVLAVHDLHASTIATGLPVLSGHIVLPDECFNDGHAIDVLDAATECLSAHHGIELHHITIQLEPQRIAAIHAQQLHA